MDQFSSFIPKKDLRQVSALQNTSLCSFFLEQNDEVKMAKQVSPLISYVASVSFPTENWKTENWPVMLKTLSPVEESPVE